MSRTIKFGKAGGPEVLEFVETQVPAPGPHEVRIKVKAIGINRGEVMWRNDKFIKSNDPIKFPAGLGYEAAGESRVGARWTYLRSKLAGEPSGEICKVGASRMLQRRPAFGRNGGTRFHPNACPECDEAGD